MYILAFSILSIVGAAYHIFFRKRADLLTIAYFGSLVYFLPAYVGFVRNPFSLGDYPSIPIVSTTYYVYYAVILGNIIFAVLSDLSNFHNREIKHFEVSPTVIHVLIVALVGSFVLALLQSGSALFSPDKSDVADSAGRFLAAFTVISRYAFVVSVLQRHKILTPLAVLAMVMQLFMGFRSSFAIVVIAVLAHIIIRRGTKVIFNPKFVILLMSFGAFVFAYKRIYIFVKMGRFDLIADRVSGGNFFVNSIAYSEPFTTQFVLNEVIVRHYVEPISQILLSFLLIIPGLVNVLNINVSLLSFRFQEMMFPSLDYGLASSIYANWYAALGFSGVLLLVLVLNSSLVACYHGIMRSNGLMRVALLLIGAYLSFYINRQSMEGVGQSLERYILFGASLYFISIFIDKLIKRNRIS